MTATRPTRGRPAVQITLPRAARLYRLVNLLAGGPRPRMGLLDELGIGLRTFYRELELLRRCGLRIRLEGKAYRMRGDAEAAYGLLPFPDPQLSFAEMTELAAGTGPAARRLAALLDGVRREGSDRANARPAPRRRGPAAGR
jgi:predicted DNA-binding transcriptional regulator YafY